MKFLFKLILFIILTCNLFATEIIIFHINDIHGRAEDTDKSIGYAKIATMVNDARDENSYVLFLDAGDTFHGSLFSNLSQGSSIVEILNKMKLDAMTLGNHDFNYGVDTLKKLIKKAKFPVLGANIIDSKGNKVFASHVIKNFGDIKVGIFGISTPETKYKTNPLNVDGLTFLDAKRVAQEQVFALQREGVDFIIALVHLGLDSSSNLVDRSSYLSTVAGVDLIIDGHSHSVLSKGEIMRNVLITQSGAYGEYLGRIVVNIDKGQKKIEAGLINKTSTLATASDGGVLSIIKKYNKRYKEIISKKVAETPVKLEGDRDIVRSSETNLGMLIADSLREKGEVDIGFINSGGIRDSINQGDILYGDVLSVLPFSNIVVGITLSGKQILAVLEKSVANLPQPSGSFLQVSGVTFDVDLSKKSGRRVSNIFIGEQKLDMGKKYKIALPDFLSAGGDGYSEFKESPILFNLSTLDEIFIEYLQKINLLDYKFTDRMNLKMNN